MPNDKKIGADLETFVDQLIQEKGLDNLDGEVLDQLKGDLLVRVEERVNATIIAALAPDKLEEAQKIIEEGDEKKMRDYFAKNIPHLDETIASELMAFRQTYLA